MANRTEWCSICAVMGKAAGTGFFTCPVCGGTGLMVGGRPVEARRTYTIRDVAPFWLLDPRGPNGLLSNMAPCGTGMEVNGLTFKTSDAIYWALSTPDVVFQRKIAGARALKEYMTVTRAAPLRPDWNRVVSVQAMRLTLAVKLKAMPGAMGGALEATKGKPIVAVSGYNEWWGAKPRRAPDGTVLRGANVLGRLLMELREQHAQQRVPSLAELSRGLAIGGRPVESVLGSEQARAPAPVWPQYPARDEESANWRPVLTDPVYWLVAWGPVGVYTILYLIFDSP